jgi:flagellar motor switch protein FliN/FliY
MADQDPNTQAPPGKGTGGLNLGDLAGGTGAGEGGALLQQVDEPDRPPTGQELDAIYNIPVQLSAVLGKTTMQVSQLLKLGRGAVVELDRKVGEAIDIYVNNRLVARGEVVVVEERLGITMTEIIKGHEQVS